MELQPLLWIGEPKREYNIFRKDSQDSIFPTSSRLPKFMQNTLKNPKNAFLGKFDEYLFSSVFLSKIESIVHYIKSLHEKKNTFQLLNTLTTGILMKK